jgi:hypothetical protein
MRPIRIKRWEAISLIIVASLWLCVGLAQYFAKNPMYVDVWFRRLMGDRIFYLERVKIETPEGCAIDPSSGSERVLITFRCATAPKELEGVNLMKSVFANDEVVFKAKEYTEEFIEFDEYIYMVVGPKQGSNEFSMYYLKRQNIMVSSDSQELAKKFADLLVKYDFRVEGETLRTQ